MENLHDVNVGRARWVDAKVVKVMDGVKGTQIRIDAERAQPKGVWWKEPLMWLVIGLPASVVVAGIYTIMLAVQSAP